MKIILILVLCVLISGCKEETQQEIKIKKEEKDSVKEKTPEDIYMENLSKQEDNLPIKYYLHNIIRDKKLKEQYDKYYACSLNHEAMFLNVEKNGQQKNFLLIRKINMNDTVSSIEMLETNLTIEEAIETAHKTNDDDED